MRCHKFYCVHMYISKLPNLPKIERQSYLYCADDNIQISTSRKEKKSVKSANNWPIQFQSIVAFPFYSFINFKYTLPSNIFQCTLRQLFFVYFLCLALEEKHIV